MAQRFRFRNVLSKPIAKWEDILPLGGTTDGFIVAGNSKFIAFPLQGGMGSTLGVLNYQQAGRVKQITQIRAHTAHITDFKFLPYEENHAITASQDATIKIWRIEDSNDKDIEKPQVTLSGHGLKVNLVQPHHAARGIIASSSNDKTVKIWDSLEAKDVFTINQGQGNALSLDWSHDGNILGTTWTDKQVRIIDPRQQTFVREFGAHQSTRASKFAWLGNSGQFVTTGFDAVQKRQIFLWDIRNTSKHQELPNCSQGQGILHPFYDSDLGILYLNGKGESLIRFYEHQNGTLTCHLNDILSNDTTKGYGFLPKYTNDTSTNEICRVVKLCGKYAEALSIVYPRKNNDFAEDLYPHVAGQFGADASSWVHGQTVSPQLISMKDKKPVGSAQSSVHAPVVIEAHQPVEIKAPVAQTVPVVTVPVVVAPVVVAPVVPVVVQVVAVEEPVQHNRSHAAHPKEEEHIAIQPSTNSPAAPERTEQVVATSRVNLQDTANFNTELKQLKEQSEAKDISLATLNQEIAQRDQTIALLQESLERSQQNLEQSVRTNLENFEREFQSFKETTLNQIQTELEQARTQNTLIEQRSNEQLDLKRNENEELQSKMVELSQSNRLELDSIQAQLLSALQQIQQLQSTVVQFQTHQQEQQLQHVQQQDQYHEQQVHEYQEQVHEHQEQYQHQEEEEQQQQQHEALHEQAEL